MSDLNILGKKSLPFIASCLINMATAITSVWGSANIYYLSYFQYQSNHISAYTNSLILLATVVSLALSLLASTPLIKRIGPSQTIKILALILFAAQFAIFIKFNLIIFIIFSVIIPTCCLFVSLIPNMNLLWTHYTQRKSICTAVSVIFLDLGSVFWNIFFVYLVNPNNQQAIIDSQGNGVFSEQLVQHMQETTKKMMAICSSIFLIGALLSLENKNVNQDEKGLNKQKDSKTRQLKEASYNEQIWSKKSIAQQQTNKTTNNDEIVCEQDLEQQPIEIQKVLSGPLKTAIKQRRCLLIFLLTIIFNIYPIFLMNNFKLIYLPYINDDQFLVNMLILYNIMNMVGAFVWGVIAQKQGTKCTLLLLVMFSFAGSVFGFFSYDRVVIIIFTVTFGLIDRGMETIVGPALAQIFGTKTASLLLPYKGICFLLSNLIAPLMQLITAQFLDAFNQLKFLSIFCLMSITIGIYYSVIQNRLTNKQQVDKTKQVSNKVQSQLEIKAEDGQSQKQYKTAQIQKQREKKDWKEDDVMKKQEQVGSKVVKKDEMIDGGEQIVIEQVDDKGVKQQAS